MKKIFTLLSVIALGTFANAQIVINEVYGGGGNTGATYNQDYVELKNIGSTVATLTGASLQYASNTGTFNSYQALPNITLNPGQTYLISEANAGANGAALPTPDLSLNTSITFSNGQVNTNAVNLSATNGKLALVSDLLQVTYTAPNTFSSNVIDVVGFGTANAYEGSAPAEAGSNTLAVTRVSSIDTNDNKNDFDALAPNPQNSASTLAVRDITKSNNLLIKNSIVDNTLMLQAKAKADVKLYNAEGKLVKSATVTPSSSNVDLSSLNKGVYILTAEVNGETYSQKIIKK